jgi:phospholipid/cholesterol/gamma-HCH transport system permease protein
MAEMRFSAAADAAEQIDRAETALFNIHHTRRFMSSTDVSTREKTAIHSVGRATIAFISEIGDLALFALQMVGWLCSRLPRRSVLVPTLYQIGVLSIPVVVVTGAFIGMVLAVQTYEQLRMMRLETRLGAVINISLVKELGPVLAATMLAGRVGSAMAAELGTMRVTEQIDALRALGANPIHYLVVPRFLACFLLIPMLTAVADGVGILGGWFFSTQVLGINSFHYWHHANSYVTAYDVLTGVFKSIFFGGAIALIACHRGFNCGAGAEGVGKAATESFVYSFIAILTLDFFLAIIQSNLYYLLWPSEGALVLHESLSHWAGFVG